MPSNASSGPTPTDRGEALPGLGSLPGEKPAGGCHTLCVKSMFSARTEDSVNSSNE